MTDEIKIPCLFCNELFVPPRPWSKFCTPKCRNNYHNDARYREKGDESVPKIKCPHCKNEEFSLFDTLNNDGKSTFYLCNVCAKEFIWENQ